MATTMAETSKMKASDLKTLWLDASLLASASLITLALWQFPELVPEPGLLLGVFLPPLALIVILARSIYWFAGLLSRDEAGSSAPLRLLLLALAIGVQWLSVETVLVYTSVI